MSPVSPVFHTVVTVSIGIKKRTQSGNVHSIILDVLKVASNSALAYPNIQPALQHQQQSYLEKFI